VGRTLTIGTSFGLGRGRAGGEVVGVAGNVRHDGLRSDARAEVYLCHRQFPVDFARFVMKTSDPSPDLGERVRDLVARQDPELAVFNIQPMTEWLQMDTRRIRTYSLMLGLFSVAALLLAAVGVYGVIAFSVRRRTREVGVRMALGAARSEVLGMVLKEGMFRVGIGIAIGLVGAALVTRLLGTFLYGVGPTDPVTYAAVALVIALTAFIASLIPARWATRVDPVDALRAE
jgi:putative ABC transport system permease protein